MSGTRTTTLFPWVWIRIATAALALLGLLIAVPGASADLVFGTVGSGAGQTGSPRGVAVDNSNGLVYVADHGNRRVDVFASDGSFIRAFGWGVADGVTPALQVCTATCFKGLEGGGAGQFEDISSIAVDNDPASPTDHDVYVGEHRVQEFTPGGEFLRMWGGGVITGGAAGSGDISAGSATITNVKTAKKAFAVSQEVSGAGIPPGARIVELGEGTITLSQAASASGASVAFSVAEGIGNVPQNEVQVLEFGATFHDAFELVFSTPNPSPSEGTTAKIPNDASPAQVQAALVALPSIEPGDISVTSPNPGGEPGVVGGPYTIEFKGRYADTNVKRIAGPGGSPVNSSVVTTQDGAGAAEICTAAHADDCAEGVAGDGTGQFDDKPQVALAPGATVYVGDGVEIGHDLEALHLRLQKFDSSGNALGTVAPSSEIFSPSKPLAVDSSGNYYVGSFPIVRKFDPAGNPLATLEPQADLGSECGPEALAVDPADDLFVGCFGGASHNAIVEYAPSGTLLRVSYPVTPINPNGLAYFHTAAGDVFAAQGFESQSRIAHIPFPPPGPVIFNSEAAPVGNVRATMKASFNPEGKATAVHFQYVDDASFQSGGFASPNTQTTPDSPPSPANFKVASASVTVLCSSQAPSEPGCLKPDTTYHFRAIAANADGTIAGPDTTFKTLPPLKLGESWSTDVSIDAATLHASLSPSSLPTTGRFQYVDDATYQASGFAAAREAPDPAAGAAPFDFGSGEAEVERSAPLFGLQPGTTYHYRLLASDHFGAVASPEHTLTTFRPIPADTECPNQDFRGGPAAKLADCRAYEMVSPLDKNNGDIVSPVDILNTPESFYESSSDGAKVTYSSIRAFGDVKSAPYVSQYLSSRGTDGWSTHAINSAKETNLGPGTNDLQDIYNPFVAFSPDLSTAWLWSVADPPLAPGGLVGYPNLYRRDNTTDTYTALSTVQPPNVAPYQAPSHGLVLLLQAFSAGGSHVVFTANDKLTANAANPKVPGGTTTTQLYEYVNGGKLRLVSILPSGTANTQFSSAGNGEFLHFDRREAKLTHAVSEDGSRIFWTSSVAPDSFGQIYVRINASKTVPVGTGEFLAADPQGTKAIYVAGSGAGSFLKEFDVETQTTTTIASHVVAPVANSDDRVADASEDLSRIYFSSTDVLAPGAAAGQPNLYLFEEGQGFTFIGRHASPTNGSFNPGDGRYVTPDGLHMDFESRAPLTGYDNTDASPDAAGAPQEMGGAADREVYRYDATTKTLLCVSCNPTEARPDGADADESSVQDWVAAQLPQRQRALYARRSLSDDGSRLFFESYDALLPTDTNGKRDVYEWEEPGSGDCRTESANYFKPNGGCLSLISSGTSPGDAQFVDADADGSDAFFTTETSLLPQDYGLIDVYDARERGGFPPPPGPSPACEGEACQGAPSPPNDPTPASSAFEGAGNVVEKPAKKHRKKAHKKRKRQHRRNAKGRAGR